MNKFFKYKRFIIFWSSFFNYTFTFLYSTFTSKKLPVFQPAMVNYELVDSTIQHVKKFHRIADFELINQNGKTVTQKILMGKYMLLIFLYNLPYYLHIYDR